MSPEKFKCFEPIQAITYDYQTPQQIRTDTQIKAYLNDEKLSLSGFVVIDKEEGILIKVVKHFLHLKNTTDKVKFKGKRDSYKLIINTFYGLLGQGGGRLNNFYFSALTTY